MRSVRDFSWKIPFSIILKPIIATPSSSRALLKLGIEPEFDQSAAYISNWLEALKNDKGLIFKAASEAQKAVDFIMDAGGADRMRDDEAA